MNSGCDVSVQWLLLRLFDGLERRGIRYLVIRNYQDYPRIVTGDVDIVINPRDHVIVDRVISDVISGTSWRVFKTVERPFMFAYMLVNDNAVYDERKVIAFDFSCGLSWLGLEYVAFDKVWNNRVLREGFWSVSDEDSSVITLLHYILYNCKVPKKYHDFIFNHLPSRSYMCRLINPFLPTSLVERIIASVRTGQWNDLSSIRGKLIHAIMIRNFTHNPIRTVSLPFKLVFTYLRAIFLKQGRVLMIRTQAEEASLSYKIAQHLLSIVKHYHLFSDSSRIVPYYPERTLIQWLSIWVAQIRGGLVIIPVEEVAQMNMLAISALSVFKPTTIRIQKETNFITVECNGKVCIKVKSANNQQSMGLLNDLTQGILDVLVSAR